LQLNQYDLVGGISLSVGLWMFYRASDVFDSKLDVEFGELLIYELAAIVG